MMRAWGGFWCVAVVLLGLAGRFAPACAQIGAQVGTGTVEVVVHGVRDGRGHVLVAVCHQWDFLQERCEYNGVAEARQGTVTVHVENVPAGIYAVQAWHDANDNGRLERNIVGIPREGVGFSRDPSFSLGPPRFGSASFAVGVRGGQTALTLRYLLN